MNRSLLACAFSVFVLASTAAALAQQSGGSAAARPASSPVNINTATAAQLEELPGIGPRTAGRIVEYRQKNGGFKKLEDLMNVQGVGEKSFLRIKALITLTLPREKRETEQ
jgi:competence protein ComEA